MSSTNKTVTIELSQYIGTDKPTYLTDYNGDMLKIDNAIAADRDSITAVDGKADTANTKADTNKSSIDNLSAQINGDPLDPTTPGLASRVASAEGDIDTIQALIGNGTPTTQDKTIIGAINELAGEIVGPSVTTETLAALGTNVTFTVPTTGNHLIDFYASDGSNYTAIDTSVLGSVTLTYESAAYARTISMLDREV